MKLGVAVGAMLVAVVGCSGSHADVAAARTQAVARLAEASPSAAEADQPVVDHLRELLPGEQVPTQLLTKAGRDPSFPELERWRGRIGAWYVDALQTTNDSQAGCVPWGTISVVAFSATRPNVEQSYAEWRSRLSAMLSVTPVESGSGIAVWPENRRAPWYARWRASVAVTSPGELTIEMSCGDAWTGLRGRRTRG